MRPIAKRSLRASRMRSRADVKGVEQPRDVEEPRTADHDVDDVVQRAGAEDVGQHVGLAAGETDDAPVEGADDHHEQGERLEPPQHLHRYLLVESEKVLIATYLPRCGRGLRAATRGSG